MIARPSGCSLCCSTAAAMAISSSGSRGRTCRSCGVENDVGDLGIAKRQCARLVERNHLDSRHLLEEYAPLDQHAFSRGRAQGGNERDRDRDHDGTRRGRHHQDCRPHDPGLPGGLPEQRGSVATRIAASTTSGLYLAPNFSISRWLVPFFS